MNKPVCVVDFGITRLRHDSHAVSGRSFICEVPVCSRALDPCAAAEAARSFSPCTKNPSLPEPWPLRGIWMWWATFFQITMFLMATQSQGLIMACWWCECSPSIETLAAFDCTCNMMKLVHQVKSIDFHQGRSHGLASSNTWLGRRLLFLWTPSV